MATRQLNDLDPEVQPIFFALLARFTEAGIPVQIINVLRTEDEQKANLAKGVSSTMNSRHLPQPPSGKSHAIDVCPYMQFTLHGANKLDWDDKDPVWEKMGIIGEALGLRWGGRWQHPHDPGHFEWNPKGEERVSKSITATASVGDSPASLDSTSNNIAVASQPEVIQPDAEPQVLPQPTDDHGTVEGDIPF